MAVQTPAWLILTLNWLELQFCMLFQFVPIEVPLIGGIKLLHRHITHHAVQVQMRREKCTASSARATKSNGVGRGFARDNESRETLSENLN